MLFKINILFFIMLVSGFWSLNCNLETHRRNSSSHRYSWRRQRECFQFRKSIVDWSGGNSFSYNFICIEVLNCIKQSLQNSHCGEVTPLVISRCHPFGMFNIFFSCYKIACTWKIEIFGFPLCFYYLFFCCNGSSHILY